jgi:hypothetical protein
MWRLISAGRPRYFFGEQVAGSGGETWFASVRASLEILRYDVRAASLNAAGVGAPHIRQRLYFVGIAEHVGSPEIRELGATEDERRLREFEGSGHAAGSDGYAERVRPQGLDGEPGGEEVAVAGAVGGYFWHDCEWLRCRDEKFRPAKPGIFPLVDGLPDGVGRVRDPSSPLDANGTAEGRKGRLIGYGNAIVPQAGAEFIRAFMESGDFTVAKTSTQTDVHKAASRACSMTLASDQNAPVLTSEPAASAPAPQQQISILGPEPWEIDFPKFDLARLESMSELDRRRDADAMDLPTLGTFIRPALVGIRRLVEAYRPYIEKFMERTGHQGEQKMLTNSKGERASREEVVREQLGVGVRRVNQLLAATGPEPPKLSKTHLTELQAEVVQAVIGQGYKEKDARSMVKAAEGNDFDTLFRSALSNQAGKPIAPIRGRGDRLGDEAESGGPLPRAGDPPVVEPSVIGGEESAPAIEEDPQIAAENAATLVLNPEASAVNTNNAALSSTRTPENVLVPPTATYGDWEGHRIPAPDFNLKYFAAASENFKDRFHCAFQGAAFQKILGMLKSKPDQVLSHAQDFEHMVAVLRAEADHLNLLAAVITTVLTPSPGPAAAPTPAKTSEEL